MDDMEEGVAGFRVTGDWGEIVEHGERVTRALRDVLEADGDAAPDGDVAPDDVDERAFEEWDDWRPKSHELLDAEVREKTAQHASVDEGEGEQAGASPDDDIRAAGEKLAESYEKLGEDERGEAVEKWQDSIGHVARAADSAGRKALRSVEDTVYRRVMTQVAPYYFDNELVSANVTRNGGGEDPFALEINVNDDDLKGEIGDRLAEYADEVDRWHVDSEKVTDAVEAAEGVEAPETEPDSDSTTT